jgi:hypothetical protein
MILRLFSPRARGLLVLLALRFGAGLRYSGPVNDAERNSPQGRGLQPIGDSVVSAAGTDDIPGTRQSTRTALPGNSRKDVRRRQRCGSALQSAKFDSQMGGSASIDDRVSVPQSGEHPQR